MAFQEKLNLRKYYTIFLEIGLIVALMIFIVAMNVNLPREDQTVNLSNEQEVVTLRQIPQTEQKSKPVAPAEPKVAVETPTNEPIIDDPDIDTEPMGSPNQNFLELPPKTNDNKEEQIFRAVEQEPELIGGIASLQKKVEYPVTCRRANIEGAVYLNFVVNKQGNVSNVQVTRGLPSEACNQAAVEALKKHAKFRPGRQRGEPVNVRHSLRIVFRLQN